MAGAKRGKRGAPAGEANQREHKRQREAEPKLDYFPSTSMPLQGWFQPCR